MTIDCGAAQTDTCPTRQECYETFLALLPRGRAWQSHDVGIPRTTSVLKQFWYAIAGPWYSAETAICSTLDDFFCSTTVTDLDAWLEEYGLPNDCEPFGEDLCAKVKAQGGTSIAYYEGLATDLGWHTSMRWLKGDDIEYPGVRATLHVVIYSDSANFTEGLNVGDWELGLGVLDSLLGDANGETLVCTLDRIVPAHIEITYELVEVT